MIIDEVFDADKLIEFLAALVKDAGKKVFLISDNLRVHHSKLVKAWAAQRADQIELFYLAQLQPAAKPTRATQCAPKAGDGQACASTNQNQAAGCGK